MFEFIKKLKNRKQRKTHGQGKIYKNKLEQSGLLIPTFDIFKYRQSHIEFEFELPCKIESYLEGPIKMGAFSYTSKGFKYFCNLEIGRFCSIDEDVLIGPETHSTDDVSSHPMFSSDGNFRNYGWERDLKMPPKQEILFDNRVQIGDDVWIGRHVRIKGDLNIGTGAVIEMGSIVTKDVPEYAIVSGIPARIIGYRKVQQPYAQEYKSWGVINNDNLEQYTKLD